MPLEVDRLTKESSTATIRGAINKSIQQCMDEGGRDQKQCAAIAYDIARKKTGKELGRG